MVLQKNDPNFYDCLKAKHGFIELKEWFFRKKIARSPIF